MPLAQTSRQNEPGKEVQPAMKQVWNVWVTRAGLLLVMGTIVTLMVSAR